MAQTIRTSGCRITSRICARVSAIARDRLGSVAGLFAGALPILVGVFGLSVDAGLWYDNKRAIQTAADAAAIAAAYRLAENNGVLTPALAAAMTAAAIADAKASGFDTASPATVAVNNPPGSGAFAGNAAAAEVILTDQRPLLFASLFLNANVTIAAHSVAAVKTIGTACVLALDPDADRTVWIKDGANIDIANCSAAANSKSEEAIAISGSSSLTADTLWTEGNYSQGNSASVMLEHAAETHAWPLADPFAGTAIPALGGCTADHLSLNHVTRTLSPGVYCNGLGIGSNSVIALDPGTYYIDRGDFTVASTATVTCNCSAAGSGVTIVLTSSGSANQIGKVAIDGGATVTLNAPSDPAGAFRGLLFFQDPAANSIQASRFSGGAPMNLTGGIYFPAGNVEWTGINSGATPACTQIVAKRVAFTGNSSLNDRGCAAAGVNPIRMLGIALAT
jgi:Flp pilus assembly protein TadG